MFDGFLWVVQQTVLPLDRLESTKWYSFQTRDVLKQIECGVYELLTVQCESVLVPNDRYQSLEFIWTEIIHWHHLYQLRCGEGPLELVNGQREFV